MSLPTRNGIAETGVFDGTRAKTTGAEFTYVAGPSVTAVSPDTGPPSGGTAITITGTNLTGATSVLVAGLAATDVRVVSNTSMPSSGRGRADGAGRPRPP